MTNTITAVHFLSIVANRLEHKEYDIVNENRHVRFVVNALICAYVTRRLVCVVHGIRHVSLMWR